MINKAIYMCGTHNMETRDIEVSVPKDKEVLIKLEYV
ncbi:MAG TPA: alcohol dehydrogenase, partial [Clostridium sp.]|nr:alcohol dehydrogenase [Clostridium sp.]